MAEENAKAGEHLIGRSRNRAAASRFYYAAYQAAHAILFSTPLVSAAPSRGNWDHGPLANALKDGALRRLRLEEGAAERLRRLPIGARDARIEADYGAGVVFMAESVLDAQKAASQLIALAYRHGAKSR
jgi:uncharacterized protein (UPF0332 family)